MISSKLLSLMSFYNDIGIKYLLESLPKELYSTLPKNFNNPAIINKDLSQINESSLSKVAVSENITNNIQNKLYTIEKQPIYQELLNIHNLDSLKKHLMEFEGCSLKKTAINTVFGVGSDNASVMLIGEAPGAEEDELGEPFVGRSGKLLTTALLSMGLSRENNLFITNTVFWRPPGNRNPTIEEMQLCYPYVKRMIEIINPKLLILVGKVATTNLIVDNIPISKMRGRWYNINFGEKSILTRVVFHPAYLLRNPIQKKYLWFDLLEIKDKIIELIESS